MKIGMSRSSKVTAAEFSGAFSGQCISCFFFCFIDRNLIVYPKTVPKMYRLSYKLRATKKVMARILREAILYGNLCVRKGLRQDPP